ncbi:MAG: hypothetical protein CME34_08425 [Gordonia sp.]|nr:hypothetical protein [Gordonia sp. (in: high G+C Gram-positive bacteria)]
MSNQHPHAEVIKVHIDTDGRIFVTIRCPHCHKLHWHGGGGGHRVAHCAGRKAERLRREIGSLEYEIAQRDIDQLLAGAA